MADDPSIQALRKDVTALQAKITRLSKCVPRAWAGGVLSSESFRGERVIHRHTKVKLPDDDKEYVFDDCLNWFRDRDWDKIGKRIIIDPYDEDNVTPFSYDLSLGDKIFSVRDRKRQVQSLPYPVQAGETAVVFTEQFIGLPPIYAATVWPRFGFVLQGVLQSMVKIDPTWYGNLAVAISNLSPRPFRLERGDRFGTLILYGLASKADVNLWHPDQLADVEVTATLAGLPDLGDLSKKLDKDEYRGVVWIDGQQLRARGLKNSTCQSLRREHASPIWQRAVDSVWAAWRAKKKKGAGIVPMAALGMRALEAAVPKGDPGPAVTLDKAVTEQDLRQAAEEYGRPFDLVHGLPSMLAKDVRETVSQQLDAEVGRTVYPNVVSLVLRIVGVLGLGVGLVALVIRFMTYSAADPGKPTPSDTELQKLMIWGIILLGAFLFLLSMTMTPKNETGLLRRFGARCYRLLGEVRTCLSGRSRHRRNRQGTKERK